MTETNCRTAGLHVGTLTAPGVGHGFGTPLSCVVLKTITARYAGCSSLRKSSAFLEKRSRSLDGRLVFVGETIHRKGQARFTSKENDHVRNIVIAQILDDVRRAMDGIR